MQNTPNFEEKISIKRSKLPILLGDDLYSFYKNQPRPHSEDYSLYVVNPYDDYYLEQYTNLTTSEVIDFVRNNISYCSDLSDEYPKYPVETLVDGCGDCEDKAILCANILYLKEVNVSLIRFKNHMNILVDNEIVELVNTEEYSLDDAIDVYSINCRPILILDWNAIIYFTSSFYWIDLDIDVYNYGCLDVNNVTVIANVSNVTRSIIVDVEKFSYIKINLVFEMPFKDEEVNVTMVEK